MKTYTSVALIVVLIAARTFAQSIPSLGSNLPLPVLPTFATTSSPVVQAVPIETTTSTTTTTTSAPQVPTVVLNGQCTTPVGKTGTCVALHHCASLFNLVKSNPLLEEDRIFLRRSQCGFQSRTVLVCCPDQEERSTTVPAPAASSKMALLPKPGKCGTMLTNRLYGGYNTEIDSYRWSALLEYSKGENGTGHHCGGTLINNRYVLTAAHCISEIPATWSLIRVRLGEWDTATDRDCEKFMEFEDCADSHIDIPIESIIPHSGYLPMSRNRLHDIALIRLSVDVNTTDFIQPICLPSGNKSRHAFDEQSLDLVGWGANADGFWTPVKQKADAPVIPINNCRQNYSTFNIELEASQFCIEGKSKNDTCRVDSGGAAISFDTSRRGLGSFFIAGIQSFGTPCWNENFPSVYTRVSEYMDWILENIQP